MYREQLQQLRNNISQVIIGKEEVTELLLTALLARGNCLIDDVPGVGKTKLANALARSLGIEFKRIQFTPDLQPADITGIYFYNQKQGEFQFRSGPVFTNILLADEINRAVPRTQSSLLEAMEEQQVSIEGTIFSLPDPFMVIATQNPLELEGTFPLPEAQLDRFLLKIQMGYPTVEQEAQILARFKEEDPLTDLEPVLDGETILKLRKEVTKVHLSQDLMDYVARLAAATRENPHVRLGLSPRGSLALMRCALAYAYLQGRDYVLPDDLKYLFPYVASHRLILQYASVYGEENKLELVEEILAQVPVPVEDVARG
ncbi:MAG: MoxR family ATPase [Firmicutes bacterium]|jgi:MoxR-like ATPase|nr:MoxR family ATPase [Bacillota bacterium]NLO65125.1 MoxR family ATPase [Bacillota bacterium]